MLSPATLTTRERAVLGCADMPARQAAVRLLMPVTEILEFRHRLRAKGYAAR